MHIQMKCNEHLGNLDLILFSFNACGEVLVGSEAKRSEEVRKVKERREL